MTREKKLKLLEKGIWLALTNKLMDKFSEIEVSSEPDVEIRSQIVNVIGSALGETLDRIEVPTQWRRFVKRKDCPKYLKKIITYEANAYYPKVSLPSEKPYITFDRYGEE